MDRGTVAQLSTSSLLAVLLLAAGCAPDHAGEDPRGEDVTAAVEGVWDEYASSLMAGDIDRWLSLWTEDGIQMPPDEAPVVGKERIRERNQAVADRFTVDDMEIQNTEVVTTGDWAYARGTYTARLLPRGEGAPINVDGKYMSILRRHPDGSWRIHRDIFNSNVPPSRQ